MGIDKINLAILLTVTHVIFLAGCKKKNTAPCWNYTPYSFNVTSEFSNQQEIYNVGDTIVLFSSFPKTLLNIITNQEVSYSNSTRISGNFKTSLMDTTDQRIKESLNKFSLATITGQIVPSANSPDAGVSIIYSENLFNYEFKMSIKLLSKGLFCLAVTNLGSQGIIGKGCTNAGFNMTVTNSNKNINLFEYALNYTPDAMLQKSIYCFRVQ